MNDHNRLLQGLWSRLGASARKPEDYRRFIIQALTEVLSNGATPRYDF